MSEIVRLTLVSHGFTDAMAAGRFGDDEPLNCVGRRQCGSGIETADAAYCGPEQRTRQTAELLGLDAETDSRLTDLDCGCWRGSALDDIDPAEVARWRTDPEQAPPGGESVIDLVARVRGWLHWVSATPGRITAVSHPAVVRAATLVALDAPPKAFWRIDVAPASRTVLHYRTPGWTLRV